MSVAPPQLEVRGVSKAYGGVAALDDVSLTLAPQESHALVGENGAGKSTLIGIISGARAPDAGAMSLGGEEFVPANAKEALQAGIGTVYQDPQIVAGMTVAENIFLGRFETTRGGWLNGRRMTREAERLIEALELELRPHATCERLSVAEQQLLQIARAASYETLRVLILDEPTSALTPSEADRLFELVSRLRAQGVSILFVTHRLEEVMEHAQRVTILRDGQRVTTVVTTETDIDELVRHMVGREIAAGRPASRGAHSGVPALEVERLSGGRFHDISFDVRAGEILGIFGLVGSGRTEVLRAIFGIDPVAEGTIRLHGEPYEPRTVGHAVAHGLALIPEDRKAQGLVPELSVVENLMLVTARRHTTLGFVRRAAHREVAQRYIAALGIRTASPEAPVSSLSGGNQQKVVIARWLAADPRVLLLDEPAAGIDVGAKADVYRLIEDLAARGIPVVVVSSELPEILRLADRIAVMHEGRLTGVLDRADATEERLVGLASLGIAEIAA